MGLRQLGTAKKPGVAGQWHSQQRIGTAREAKMSGMAFLHPRGMVPGRRRGARGFRTATFPNHQRKPLNSFVSRIGFRFLKKMFHTC